MPKIVQKLYFCPNLKLSTCPFSKQKKFYLIFIFRLFVWQHVWNSEKQHWQTQKPKQYQHIQSEILLEWSIIVKNILKIILKYSYNGKIWSEIFLKILKMLKYCLKYSWKGYKNHENAETCSKRFLNLWHQKMIIICSTQRFFLRSKVIGG